MAATRIKSALLNLALLAAVALPALVFADRQGGFLFFNERFKLIKMALSLLLPFCTSLLYLRAVKNTRAFSVIVFAAEAAFFLLTELFERYYIHYSVFNMQYHYAYALLAFFAAFFAALLALRLGYISCAAFKAFYGWFFVGYTFVVIYLFAMLYIMQRRPGEGYYVNLVPFCGELREMWRSLGALTRSAGNVLFYSSLVPLTAYLFKKAKPWALICCPVALSLLCEVFQGLTHCGNADIDDVILNSLGVALGYCIFKFGKIFVEKYNKKEGCTATL